MRVHVLASPDEELLSALLLLSAADELSDAEADDELAEALSEDLLAEAEPDELDELSEPQAANIEATIATESTAHKAFFLIGIFPPKNKIRIFCYGEKP